ncbi:ATP-dependent dethiobiotin synthetase BioD, partial [Mesorhizobium sp.]
RVLPEVYRLKEPLSPHRSAELDGVAIDAAELSLPDLPGPLVIEGAGGLMVPLNRRTKFIDIFAQWRVPVILCART